MGAPTIASAEIITYSTFTSTATVCGSNTGVTAHDTFINNALIKGWRAYATSSDNFSVTLHCGSAANHSTNLVTASTTTAQFIPLQTSEIVYRDVGGASKLHWSCTNETYTSSITLVAYYTQN